MTNYIEYLEAGVTGSLPQGISAAAEISLSQAISLKRIADAIEGLTGADARNEYGETPLQAIGAGISRALRGEGK